MSSDRDRPPYGPGQVLGSKYRLLKVLGEGGMSVVYDAVDTTCERSVAVKVIRPSLAIRRAYSREQIRREAEVLVRLRQTTEFVVDVLTAGITEDKAALPYYVMERLRGDTLREHIGEQITRKVEFTIDELTTTAMSIAMALAHAHALGVVHRDIKPENVFMAIMLDGDVKAKVLDFGICDDGTGAMEPRSGFTGTLAYAAPEQLEGGRPTPATDIYALGLVLLELVILMLPHARHKGGLTPERLAVAILKNPVPNIASLRLDLPPRLADLIARCLAVRPSDRPSALDVARILRDIKHEFLGELSGHASHLSAATDVSGPPIEVLQAQLARAAASGSPDEVQVLRGDVSVELGAATDDPHQEEDVVFSRRASTLAALEPLAASAARAASVSAAMAPRGATLDAALMRPHRVIEGSRPPVERTLASARAARGSQAQDDCDRAAAQRFVQSVLDSHPAPVTASEGTSSARAPVAGALRNVSDEPVSSDPQESPRRHGISVVRARALIALGGAAPVLLLLAVVAAGRMKGSTRGDTSVLAASETASSSAAVPGQAPPAVSSMPLLTAPTVAAASESAPLPALRASLPPPPARTVAAGASSRAAAFPPSPKLFHRLDLDDDDYPPVASLSSSAPRVPAAQTHPSARTTAGPGGPPPDLGDFRTTMGDEEPPAGSRPTAKPPTSASP